MRRALRALFVLALGGLSAEVAVRFMGTDSFGALRLLPYDPVEPIREGLRADSRSTYLVFDADLGWQVGADRHSRDGLYNSNDRGERRSSGDEPWATAFGDSFTHGDDVPDAETWISRLSALGFPTVNAGVPGYGVDQAWLRYRQRKKDIRSRVVLIGVMADNIARHLNRYRPFITPAERIYFVKPRFENSAVGLRLLESPFRGRDAYAQPGEALRTALFAVGEKDRFFEPRFYERTALDHSRLLRIARTLRAKADRHADWRPLYADPTAVDLTVAIVKGFVDEVQNDGRRPIVVFLPEKTITDDVLAGRKPLTTSFVDRLSALGCPLIDLTVPVADHVRTRPGARSFLPHYSSDLSQAVAVAIAQWKREEKSLP